MFNPYRSYMEKSAGIHPALAEAVIGGAGGALVGGGVGALKGSFADASGNEHKLRDGLVGAAIGGTLGAAGAAGFGHVRRGKFLAAADELAHQRSMSESMASMVQNMGGKIHNEQNFRMGLNAEKVKEQALRDRTQHAFGLSYNITSPKDIHRAFFG